ncbi:MAG: hypothetical protein AB8I80_09150 [Anaerolineae bacterium]|jgi:hypothetical protein
MAGPVFKFWRMRYTGRWYQLSEEEQNAHGAKVEDALAEVGGKRIITCVTGWSDEKWIAYGVEEFPSVEAAQQHAQMLFDIGHLRYTEGESTLGTEWQPS